MKMLEHKIAAQVKKTFLLFVIMFSGAKQYAQVYASAQTNGANGVCLGCAIANPQNSVDGDINTYAMAKLTVALPGADVYQNLNFSLSGSVGEYIAVVIEDSNQTSLNSTSLSGMQLTTFSNSVSNNDTKTSTQYSISPMGGAGSKYLVQFIASASFDALQLQMNAGALGSVSNLRVYYAYHASTPLPITLISFGATPNTNNVKLNWTTATEENNNYFTIERSTDSKNFYPIAEIKGAGNSTNAKQYSFVDNEPIDGVSYYRLKQTDYNGKFEYFKITEVNFKADDLAIEIYPNPLKTNNTEITIKTTTDAVVSIINSTGGVVCSANITHQPNVYSYAVKLPQELMPNIYSVITTAAGKTTVRMLLVVN